MFTPHSARVSNIVAATPGLVLMPAPITLTRAMAESLVTPVAPISVASVPAVDMARSRSPWGTVKEMSVTPSVDTFWTIMSTLIPAAANSRKTPAAIPG